MYYNTSHHMFTRWRNGSGNMILSVEEWWCLLIFFKRKAIDFTRLLLLYISIMMIALPSDLYIEFILVNMSAAHLVCIRYKIICLTHIYYQNSG